MDKLRELAAILKEGIDKYIKEVELYERRGKLDKEKEFRIRANEATKMLILVQTKINENTTTA